MSYHYGAAPARKKVVFVRRPATVTGVATGAIHLAVKPVKWAVSTTGSLVKWAGGTLQNFAGKF